MVFAATLVITYITIYYNSRHLFRISLFVSGNNSAILIHQSVQPAIVNHTLHMSGCLLSHTDAQTHSRKHPKQITITFSK